LPEAAQRWRQACSAALSNHVGVSDLNASDGASARNEQGVLTNLPRTRPQRSTPRRAAARNGAKAAAASPARARTRSSPPRERTTARARPGVGAKAAARRQQAAPIQGFECEGETASGSVQPPGAAELLASAVEVVSELTKAGVSRSERLLRDLASRLPLS
jgi:hypothetical protein